MRGGTIALSVAALVSGCAGTNGTPSTGSAATIGEGVTSEPVSTSDGPSTSLDTGAREATSSTGSTETTGTQSSSSSTSSSSSSGSSSSESTGPTSIVFLDDTFDEDLDDWQDDSDAGYELTFDAAEGPTAPALRVAGDCLASCEGRALKIVDVSAWPGTGTLTLSMSYRATSNTAVSSVTNARIDLTDADSDAEVYAVAMFAGGSTDSGWQQFSVDIAPPVGALQTQSLAIRLEVNDAWDTPHAASTWFDNVQLTWP